MVLARMLSTDRNALLCDLAETYQIYSFDHVPVRTLAILACGLRDDARIIMKLTGQKISYDRMVSVSTLDTLRMMLWMQSEDARRGINRPKSLLNELVAEKSTEVKAFDSIEEYELRRKKILERG